jgi:hypothetical protein
MLFGVLWCVGGIAATAFSYSTSKSGGFYVVTWGAVVGGALQFFRGVQQRWPRE